MRRRARLRLASVRTRATGQELSLDIFLEGQGHSLPGEGREQPTQGLINTLTRRGNDAVGSGFNDDPLWLVLAAAAYLKETGDDSILDQPVACDNAEGSETSLHDHVRRSLEYTLARLGPHGLPLIGRADWNDCLNLNMFSKEPGESFQTTPNREGGVAESVFIAALFVIAAHERRGDRGRTGATRPTRRVAGTTPESMTRAIATHGWDGAWYRRAYDHMGARWARRVNDEGQIFIEPQGIAAMAGVGLADGHAAAALASVRERLATPHGIVLVQPAYTSVPRGAGRDHLVPARLQGERRPSSATRTRG